MSNTFFQGDSPPSAPLVTVLLISHVAFHYFCSVQKMMPVAVLPVETCDVDWFNARNSTRSVEGQTQTIIARSSRLVTIGTS